jgi:rubrerythrin
VTNIRSHWTIKDLPWQRFDQTKVNKDLLAFAKAASLIEANALLYVEYLKNIFFDKPEILVDLERWGAEELQHGRVLRRWAERADPSFDFELSMKKYRRAFVFPMQNESLRGSQALELVSRCVIETGTSSFYSALRDATAEPVFFEICRRIAGDEIRHYHLFYSHLQKGFSENMTRWARIKAIFGRLCEATDEEVCFAYAACESTGEVNQKNLALYAEKYLVFLARFYKPSHFKQAILMVGRAANLPIQAKEGLWLAVVAHKILNFRVWIFQKLHALHLLHVRSRS